MNPVRLSSAHKWLLFLAAVSEAIYLLVTFIGQSLHVAGEGKQSLLVVLALFAAAFLCYLVSIKAALAATQDGVLLAVIAVAAVAFRGTLLFSDPIEEIDIYRYLWDGQASVAGVSPFRYSPRQVVEAGGSDPLPSDLARLVALKKHSAGLEVVLDRIHFGELPTIYPPTSQAIFAFAAACTPENATVAARMKIMRAWFVAFDLATIYLVVRLLRWSGKPVGWSIAYAWCPLPIKEVANSGHLDALATFLTTVGLLWSVQAFFPRIDDSAKIEREPARGPQRLVFASIALGLAIGAKLYPVVLVPLLAVTALRRIGWRATALAGLVGATVTIAVLLPMAPSGELASLPAVRMPAPDADAPPLPPPDLGTEPRDPSQSLRAFLGEWEMNDFLFLLVMENVRPTSELPADQVAWFSVVPESWRVLAHSWAAAIFSVEPGRLPFFIARSVTALVFPAIALFLALRGRTASSSADFLEGTFLTVAWFWLLLPTQNPWYWTWALPMLPFARGRAWLAVSGLAFAYYLRFWLAFEFMDSPVAGTIYKGPQFFDYCVSWLEFGPFFLWLTIAALLRRDPSSNIR
ncbi:MAG: hypothetical protein HYX69_10260 [Planctomycetia bacterium]|nr:hypothetical protein [Planctomycetia bacterium]